MAYVLQEHHLSLYEKQDENKAWLSQYHHTAKIAQADGQICKLHVYFTDKDTIADVMLLKPLGGDDYQKQEIDENSRGWFETIAIQYSLPALTPLRRDLQEHQKQLEEQYDVLEKEASLLSLKNTRVDHAKRNVLTAAIASFQDVKSTLQNMDADKKLRDRYVGLLYAYVIGKGKGVVQVRQGKDFVQLELWNLGYGFATGPGIDVGQYFGFKIVNLVPVAEAGNTPAPTLALRR